MSLSGITKGELIARLERIRDREMSREDRDGFSVGLTTGLSDAIGLAKQLEEP